MVGFSNTLLVATVLTSVCVVAFPMQRMDSIFAAAKVLQKRGMIKDPAASAALSRVNKRGLLGVTGGSIPTELSALLQTLDLPTPQPAGLAAVPDEDHPYIAPGPTDVRGLCPTLNTMANHGYLSRNGITTFAEAANACQIAFGFAFGICTGLSALGLLAGGDIVTGMMSIGGPDSRVPNTLGANQGIATHGPFEIDGSITRADTYFGDNISYKPDRFSAWTKQANDTSEGLFDFNTMSANQLSSYKISKDTNPAAYFGLKYFVVSYAERVFIPAALPNGTTQGVADYANIAPFFEDSKFPRDWFRRSTPYTAMDTVTDIIKMFEQAPVALGANEGLGNFVSIESLSIPTDSPQALMCYLVTELFDVLPGSLASEISSNKATYNLFVNTVFTPIFGAGSEFNCELGIYGDGTL